jgi:hypothetical protein
MLLWPPAKRPAHYLRPAADRAAGFFALTVAYHACLTPANNMPHERATGALVRFFGWVGGVYSFVFLNASDDRFWALLAQ